MIPPVKRNWLARLLRERSVQIAVFLWVVASLAIFPLSGPNRPLNRPDLANLSIRFQVIAPIIGLAFTFLEMGITYFLTRRRSIPDMASRAPVAAIAWREVLLLWAYGGFVLLAGRWIGLRPFGERSRTASERLAVRHDAHGLAARGLDLGHLQFRFFGRHTVLGISRKRLFPGNAQPEIDECPERRWSSLSSWPWE